MFLRIARVLVFASLPAFLQSFEWEDDCIEGRQQSPIDIRIDEATPHPLTKPVQFFNYRPAEDDPNQISISRDYDKWLSNLKIHHTGYTVQIDIPPEENFVIQIDQLPGRIYRLLQIHFHWGSHDNEGSEHTIDGVMSPLEIHFVHKLEKGVDKDDHLNQLTVLGVFGQYQSCHKESRSLRRLIRQVADILQPNSSVHLKHKFNPYEILPEPEKRRNFFFYNGSLTTPPCSETVNWIVYPDPIAISPCSVRQLRQLILTSITSNAPSVIAAANRNRIGMVRDRLAELRQKQSESTHEETVEIFPSNSSELAHTMRDFQTLVDEIRTDISFISKSVGEMKRLHSEILANPSADSRSKEILEDLMEKIKKTSMKTRSRLKTVEQQNTKEEKEHLTKTPDIAIPAELRIRLNQHKALCRRLVDEMNHYNAIQVEYREACKKRIQRQLSIAGKHVEDEKLEEMIESDNPAIFTDNIVADTQNAKQSLADIQARHNDILKLESSIRELHDMFMDMSMLVEAQGEMVDRIEYNVEQSKDYVDTAAKNTKQALGYQQSARRKKMCIVILVLVLIGVIAIIIVSSVCTQGNNCK